MTHLDTFMYVKVVGQCMWIIVNKNMPYYQVDVLILSQMFLVPCVSLLQCIPYTVCKSIDEICTLLGQI